MIKPEYARTMARYNRWQNQSLVASADSLTDAARWRDRHAFFRSIAETLNHILWDDRVWLARLRGDDARVNEIAANHPYTETPTRWPDYKRDRAVLDDEIVGWADGVTEADIARECHWMRGDVPVVTGFGFSLVQMMNHATHHRGQVNAMLTAAGAPAWVTDLPMLPDRG